MNYVFFVNQTFSDLPLGSLDYEDRWDLLQEEKGFLATLNISMEKSIEVEKLTRKTTRERTLVPVQGEDNNIINCTKNIY